MCVRISPEQGDRDVYVQRLDPGWRFVVDLPSLDKPNEPLAHDHRLGQLLDERLVVGHNVIDEISVVLLKYRMSTYLPPLP